MLQTASVPSSFSLTLANEPAMLKFMRDLATVLEPGDLVTLSGDLGAGKPRSRALSSGIWPRTRRSRCRAQHSR